MKLGLALSGGGVRGIAHAGVLRALEENNIKVNMIGIVIQLVLSIEIIKIKHIVILN